MTCGRTGRSIWGTLPVETLTLFRIIAIKKELAALRIAKLEQGRDSLVFTFQNDTPLAPEMLLQFLHKGLPRKNQLPPKLAPDGRLIIYGKLTSTEHVFDTIATTLHELTHSCPATPENRNAAQPGFFLADIETVFLDMDGTLLDKYYDDYFWEHYVPKAYARKTQSHHPEARQQLPGNLPKRRKHPAVDRSRLLVGSSGSRYCQASNRRSAIW